VYGLDGRRSVGVSTEKRRAGWPRFRRHDAASRCALLAVSRGVVGHARLRLGSAPLLAATSAVGSGKRVESRVVERETVCDTSRFFTNLTVLRIPTPQRVLGRREKRAFPTVAETERSVSSKAGRRRLSVVCAVVTVSS
jgi:hypothetical protein